MAPSAPPRQPATTIEEEVVPGGVPPSRWPAVVQVLVSPLILALALGIPVLLILLPGVRRLNEPGLPDSVATAATVGLSLVVALVAVGLVALVARLDGRLRLADLGWRLDRRWAVALVIGIALSAVVTVGVGLPLTQAGMLRPDDSEAVTGPLGLALAGGLAQAFLLQGLPEELIFRGYLLRSLRIRPGWAVAVSGVAFGLIHLVSQGGQQGWLEHVAYLAVPTGFGLAAGALVLTTRSLWAGVGVHGGLHLTNLVVGLLAARGLVPAIGEGPVLWVVSGAAYALVAGLLMLRLHRQRRSAARDAVPPVG